MAGNPGGGWGGGGPFGPPGGAPPGGGGPFGPPGGAPPGGGGFGPPGGGGPFGPPGGAPPGGFGPPGGGGFGPPGGAPPGGFGPPGGFNPGGAPPGFGPPGGGFPSQPGGFQQPGYGAPGGFNQMPPQSSSKKGILIGIAAVVIGGACVAAMVAAKAAHDKEQATFGALKTVCSGQGVATARMYNPTSPPHRVVGVARSTAGGEWSVQNSLIPTGRRATDVAGTDIVACFEPVIEQNVGTCEVWRTRNGLRVPGTTRNVPQFQLFRPVRLVSAQTGVLLNQTTLVGGAPPSCSGGGSSFRGSSPDDDEVNTYLAPLLDR